MKKIAIAALCALLMTGCVDSGNSGETNPTSPPTSETTSETAAEITTEVTTTTEKEPEKVNKFEEIYAFLESSDHAVPDGFDKQQEGVEYGELTEVEYFSKTTDNTRKCSVYLPPNYDESKTYPVLYLLHGIGGDHKEWYGGKPNEVLSNLIANGELPPIIAVIPNVRAKHEDRGGGDIYGAENIAAFDNFINDLRDDLMPFIKENYPVSDKRSETAIAGLSMGGRESLFIGASMPETFGYIGAFCPAPGLIGENLGVPAQMKPEELTLPDEYKNDTFILINAGNSDGVVGDNPLNYSKTLGDNGVKNAYYSTEGGHDFKVWKNGLYYFAKCYGEVLNSN